MADRKARQANPQQIDPVSETWNALPWRKLEQHVYRIQKRMYRANQHGKKTPRGGNEATDTSFRIRVTSGLDSSAQSGHQGVVGVLQDRCFVKGL